MARCKPALSERWMAGWEKSSVSSRGPSGSMILQSKYFNSRPSLLCKTTPCSAASWTRRLIFKNSFKGRVSFWQRKNCQLYLLSVYYLHCSIVLVNFTQSDSSLLLLENYIGKLYLDLCYNVIYSSLWFDMIEKSGTCICLLNHW